MLPTSEIRLPVASHRPAARQPYDPYECWAVAPGVYFIERSSAHDKRRDNYDVLAPWARALAAYAGAIDLRMAEAKGQA